MLFLVSGEGPSDIGVCTNGQDICDCPGFRVGPMTVIVDQVVEKKGHGSPLRRNNVKCVSKQYLLAQAKNLKTAKKSLGLPGKNREKETRYFFNAARALARIAFQVESKGGESVVAVLFRDCDGTASSERGLWQHKWNSMLAGFSREKFLRGAPMIPKPISEAWLLCALKQYPYQNCDQLEARSGSPNAKNPLKKDLCGILGNVNVADELNDRLQNGGINIDRIDMPSFNDFRRRLEQFL